MILQINLQSDVPLYEQIRIQIIEGIGTGALAPNEGLPSVRQLGSDLGINLHTVNKAYTILKDQGFIVVHRKKGVIVNPDPPRGATGEYTKALRVLLQPIIVEAFTRRMPPEAFSAICLSLFRELETKKHARRNKS